jgi:Family of unknown function (DUF5989)
VLCCDPRKTWAREVGILRVVVTAITQPVIDCLFLLRGSSPLPCMCTTSHSRRFLPDFWAFMKREKKWWLIPLMAVGSLLLLAAVLGENSPLAPFIYSFI